MQNSVDEDPPVGKQAKKEQDNILVAGSNPSLTHNVGLDPKKTVGISPASRISTAA